MSRLLIVIALVAACTRTSEKYCGLHPEDLAHCAPSDAARVTCTSDERCPATQPHCLLEGATQGVCVGCLDSTHCTVAGAEVCDPETHACTMCVEHADCSSEACLPSGQCGDDGNTIYVDPAGADTGTCTAAQKCKTITYAQTKATSSRYHVKLTGALAETVLIAGKRLVLLAGPGTKLTGGDPTLKIQQGTVSVYDLEIACAGLQGIKSEMGSTTTLRRVYVHGCGAKPAIEGKGGYLIVSRSRISNNTAGGITLDMTAGFSITNTAIVDNGAADSKVGGITIGTATSGMNNRFEHNTVANNKMKAGPGTAGGVACTPTNFLEAPNNLVAGNTPPNTIGCDFTRSLDAPDAATILFTPDYHLSAGSPAIDQVDSTIDDDIDGQFRPQGPRKDFGADEYKP